MRTLEDAVLSEMQILGDNLEKVKDAVSKTNQEEVLRLMQKIRRVEAKMSLVSTFFQTSVYSNKMLQQDGDEEITNRPSFR